MFRACVLSGYSPFGGCSRCFLCLEATQLSVVSLFASMKAPVLGTEGLRFGILEAWNGDSSGDSDMRDPCT